MSLKSFFVSSLVILMMFNSSLFGKTLINGISVLVNDEPITLYEVHKLSKQMDISLKESLELLIQKRLEISQAKKLGISASEYEINEKFDEIAEQNKISSYELQQVLASKGISLAHYKNEIAEDIKTKKLYKSIFENKNASVSEQEMKNYYKSNPDKFLITDVFNVTTYKSQSKVALQEIVAAPMRVAQGATLTKQRFKNSSLDRRTAYFLEQTEIGQFTPIMALDDGYIMFMVEEKIGKFRVDFDQARPLIAETLQENRQKLAVKNYFQKLKADASIVVLRKP